MADVCVWFNPRCSKCRQSRDLLVDEGVDAELFHYLDEAPDRAQIEEVMGLLGIDDPREMMRTKEDTYRDEGLVDAGRDQLIDAMVKHPILIERPIVIKDGQAVIARPPEKLLDLL